MAAARVGLGRKTYLRLREEHPEIAEAEQAALADYVLTHLQGLGEIARGERKGAWQAHAWAIERVVPAYRLQAIDLSKLSTEQLLQLLQQLK